MYGKNPRLIPALALASFTLLAPGCSARQAGRSAPPSTAAVPAAAARDALAGDDNANATLWVQTSAEYVGATLQAYLQARLMLDQALQDPAWSADLEQQSGGGFGGLPPAVILDVDETVLDNSAYQARLILEQREYETASWNDWVREEKAIPVPGALEFTRYAASRGVTVFYVTNRRHSVEEPTRRNLVAHDFPFDAGLDTLYTRDEEPDWGSDKGTRRRRVAERYRILLLLGDNLGDFVSGVETSREARASLVTDNAGFWGTRWIMLPNPQYGSWDGALIGFEFGLPLSERRRLKLDALDARR